MRCRGLAVLFFLIVALHFSCGGDERWPTFEVQPAEFVHEVTADGTLLARETTRISVPEQVRGRVRIAWLAAEGTLLSEGDLVARFDGRQLEEELVSAEADLAQNDESVRETDAESSIKAGEYKRDFDTATLDLDFARRYLKTDEVTFSRHELIESAIDEELAEARRDHADGMGSVQESLRTTEAEILAIDRQRAENRREEADTALAALEIRAPHDGILTLVRNWRGEVPAVGSELWRGQEIAELPDLDSMEAEVYVLEADAGGLVVDRPARVAIPAHPDVSIAGTIARVDPIAKPRSRDSPVQYFGVGVEIEAEDPSVLKPGQRVVATLVMEELSDALVVPRQAVHQDENRSWVYRSDGARFEEQTVRVGTRSFGLLVIEEGLKEGDRVALEQPPADWIRFEEEVSE